MTAAARSRSSAGSTRRSKTGSQPPTSWLVAPEVPDGAVIVDVKLKHAALAMAAAVPGTGPLALRGDGWAPGVLGLVANRLVESLGRPVAVAAAVDDELRGSVQQRIEHGHYQPEGNETDVDRGEVRRLGELCRIECADVGFFQ